MTNPSPPLPAKRTPVRWPLVARRIHKWLALILCVQVALWTATGLYMTVVHIDIIHGDHLVRPMKAKPFELDRLIKPAQVIALLPEARELRLQRLFDRPVWRAETAGAPILVDAESGAKIPPLAKSEIEEAARRIYTGDPTIVSTKLLTTSPQEIQARKPPLWQVEFAGWNRPTLYISPTTGELLGRRHALWRVFDFAWILHIMDYETRENVNNPLLRVATWSAVAMALSGAWLLLWSFPRRKKKRA